MEAGGIDQRLKYLLRNSSFWKRRPFQLRGVCVSGCKNVATQEMKKISWDAET